MLILLPPSETKARSGTGPPLRLDALAFPGLTGTRRRLLATLATLSADRPTARAVLKLTQRQDAELDANRRLYTAPTLPALHRYTGVLYDALGYPSLPPPARRRADRSLLVASALFGALRPTDRIPGYRLSGGTTLPGLGPLRRLWPAALVPVLAGADDLIVDLRSAAYAALAPLPGAVTVRVLAERPDGTRTVVSHHNKHHKGRLARALLCAPDPVTDLTGVLSAAKAAGLTVEQPAPTAVDIIG